LAQNFSTACSASLPNFLRELPAGAESVNMASTRIKAEITDGLPDNEAAGIVLVAANTALRAALAEMRALPSDGRTIQRAVVARWCREKAEPYILKVLRTDRQAHDRFVAIIEQAKH
jgi:hypothetical protein